MQSLFFRCLVLSFLTFLTFSSDSYSQTTVRDNQLWIDGVAQPQLFGAELQYFRIRGGYQKNVPRDRVIELWNKALDRMTEAGMNFVSFYIPWDFHEYAEGKFDFTGSADEDGDGLPDYPSRDLMTFFRLIEEHGFQHVMVRPGPYINAEWGFLGFGAIPLWFHEKFPNSHMRNSRGQRTKLYDYHSPELLEYTRRWFSALHSQVLKDKIGFGRPINFLQLDNETNYLWQSIYNHDYSPAAIQRYQNYLQLKYLDLATLNSRQNTEWSGWHEVIPPNQPLLNINQDQDWYAFHDYEIATYLEKIRRLWEGLGVREPDVLFSLAESYNAMPFGLIPNFETRNRRQQTGLMTVNLYPKTDPLNGAQPLLNQPFKTDHDVKAANSANDAYFGSPQEWVFGPEIQGGWWRGTEVTTAARQQTYLSTIAHGLKALIVYYFTEGDNWQSEWMKQQIKPYFDKVRARPEYRNLNDENLPNDFWSEVQGLVDNNVLVGIEAKHQWFLETNLGEQLYFDAPLDRNLQPRAHFAMLKKIGQNIVQKHGSFLGAAIEVTDDVVLLKDSRFHSPNRFHLFGLDSVKMNTDWSGGVLAWLFGASFNPKIAHRDLDVDKNWEKARVVFFQDNGHADKVLSQDILKYVESGGIWFNLLYDRLGSDLRLADQEFEDSRDLDLYLERTPTSDLEKYFGKTNALEISSTKYLLSSIKNIGASFFESKMQSISSIFMDKSGTRLPLKIKPPVIGHAKLLSSKCQPLAWFKDSVAAYRCSIGNGYYYQLGTPVYYEYNSEQYSTLTQAQRLNQFLRKILEEHQVYPKISLSQDLDRVVAYARRSPTDPTSLLVTAKNGQQRLVNGSIAVNNLRIDRSSKLVVTDLITNQKIEATVDNSGQGVFPIVLDSNASTMYWLEIRDNKERAMRHSH